MKYLFIFIFVPSLAFAGNWISCPGSVCPNPKAGPVTVYSTQSACGSTCFQLDGSGTAVDLEVAVIQNGHLVEDPTQKANKVAQQQAQQTLIAARKARLKNTSTVTSIPELKQLIQDLVDQTGAAN